MQPSRFSEALRLLCAAITVAVYGSISENSSVPSISQQSGQTKKHKSTTRRPPLKGGRRIIVHYAEDVRLEELGIATSEEVDEAKKAGSSNLRLRVALRVIQCAQRERRRGLFLGLDRNSYFNTFLEPFVRTCKEDIQL